ncbi:MAG TPA: hypothetical protein VLG27_03325 [Candidatus Saccharimonadia bacterium]|nr:hypothetical protein [Candidatus Saccharimonadia bacterium]
MGETRFDLIEDYQIAIEQREAALTQLREVLPSEIDFYIFGRTHTEG